MRLRIGYIEKCLIRRKCDPVGELEPSVDYQLGPIWFDEPDFARFLRIALGRVGHVDVAVVRDGNVIANKSVGYDRRLPAWIVREDLLSACCDRVESAIRTKRL